MIVKKSKSRQQSSSTITFLFMLSQQHDIIVHVKNIEMSPLLLFGMTSAFVNVTLSQVHPRQRKKPVRKPAQRDRVASWSIVVVSSVANVVVSCLLCRQQEHAGLNPTESMTRALISDDNIARQSALGPVQLGYVLPLLVTPSIPRSCQIPGIRRVEMSPGIVVPILRIKRYCLS